MEFQILCDSRIPPTAWTDLPSKTQELILVFSKWMLEIMWDPARIYISTFESNPFANYCNQRWIQWWWSRVVLLTHFLNCFNLHISEDFSFYYHLRVVVSSIFHQSMIPFIQDAPSFLRLKPPFTLLQISAKNLCDLFNLSLENSGVNLHPKNFGACVLSQKYNLMIFLFQNHVFNL